jgi:HEAT repeat protein
VKAALAHCQDIEIRCALLQLLPLCGNADALDTLRAAALDSNSRVRDAVVRALADWPDPSVEKDLYAILQKPESEVHRSLAFRALVRQLSESNQGTDGQLPQHYRDLLQATRSDEELRLILGALGGLAQPFALDLALSLVDKPSVHAEAEAAVKRIAETIKTSDPRAAAQALSKLGLKD